mmetsp:Transcript_13342/g.29403  ORF Transcript_13342/g.29403 Transcript_13342/m.29403 type:complete len:230 (-) Transcript_13342:54-743(-)
MVMGLITSEMLFNYVNKSFPATLTEVPFSSEGLNRPISATIHFRRSTKSFTVAVLLPRRDRTTCMRSWKVKVASMVGKITPTKSKSPTTSTPTSCSTRAASGCWMSFTNSHWVKSFSGDRETKSMTSSNLLCTLLTSNCSFSTDAMTLITSTKMPTNMFITVSVATRMNPMNKEESSRLSFPISLTTSETLSKKIPFNRSVVIESEMLAKCTSAVGLSRASCVKAMPKT